MSALLGQGVALELGSSLTGMERVVVAKVTQTKKASTKPMLATALEI